MNCKESLKEYIDKDEIYQDYKQDKLMNCSDFDKFCIQHCKDIEELLEENKELELIIGLRQKRNLISKFDKEYDEEDKKKNPNREYAGIMPDAEEVYKRYYSMKKQQKEFIEYINEKIDICDGFIDTVRSDLEGISYGGRIAGKTYIANEIMKNEVAKRTFKEILSKYQEIIGGKDGN